MTNDFR
ncbi:hypothetical protein D021_2337A, partial [Vibrio parahaemolyticus 10296]